MRKADVIAYQLSLTAPDAVTFDEGGMSVITPARWIPELANVAPIRLEGPWQVFRWPFTVPVEELAGGQDGDLAVEVVKQPGKLFYYDPEQSPDSIPGWNRVTQDHLDPEDGALIRRVVTIPPEWSGRRVLLRFEGIYPAGQIYWDGALCAAQWSGLTPIEVDVTEQATPGRHVVAVRFFRWHKDIQLDMPRHALDFVGLCRAAFVHTVEPTHITDLRLQPELADDYATGSLNGEVLVENLAGALEEAILTATLTRADGRVVTEEVYSFALAPDEEMEVRLNLQAGRVQVWNAERPYLYALTLRLACPGQREQVLTRRLGFRRFELRDQRPILNGAPVKFRGVNHLTFHPQHGLYTPEEWLRENLALMKRANINAIRTHFYGPRELTDLCDEMGFYLLQELPIDWGTDYVQDPAKLGPMLHRMEAGVRRDRNHPAVMVWSVGNENMPASEAAHDAFNAHLRLCNRLVKTVDPTRPTMFPPPGPANKIKGIFETRFGDIADTHYSFTLARALQETGTLADNPRTWEPTFAEPQTREDLLAQGWSGVWFSSEYGINNLQPDLLNAPYTSIIADVMEDPLSGKNSQQVFMDRLNREWGLLRDDPTCLGGAYFCWMAAGAGDPWGWVRWGEDADWGIVTMDLLPKSVFWAMRVIFSPVRFPARVIWHPGDTEVRLTVYNDYNSIDLAACTLRTQLGGGPPYLGMLREWRDIPMAGAPGTAATVTVPIWNPGTLHTLQQGRPALCRCVVLDPAGFRPIMADVLLAPEALAQADAAAMPIGPDAEL